MPDVLSLLTSRFQSAVASAFGEAHAGVDPLIRPSGNPQFGDYQANLAMSLSKSVGASGGKPRDVAEKIKAAVDLNGIVEKIEIAGPGFINLHLSAAFLNEQMNLIAGDERLGIEKASPAQTVVIDYSSPNVAKEMHVGHLRSTIIGDAIARVMTFLSHRVIRQNHVGDWGTQFGRVMLGLWYASVVTPSELEGWIARMREIAQLKGHPDARANKHLIEAQEAALLDEIGRRHQECLNADWTGEETFLPFVQKRFPDLENLQRYYVFATSITDAARAKTIPIAHPVHGTMMLSELPSFIATFVQQPEEISNIQESTAWHKSVEATMTACQESYEQLGVGLRQIHVRGESDYRDALEKVVAELLAVGVAVRLPEGPVGILLEGFRDRDGNPLPFLIQKTNEGFLYGTTDLAAAKYRISMLGAVRIIYVTDARQAQHFAMLFAALRKAGWATDKTALEHVPFGMVLGNDGKPLKTRSGENVKLSALLDEAVDRAKKVIEEKNPELPAAERQRVAQAVGIGALKYADLSVDRVKDYVFDWDRMLSFDGNTAPYIQNAYVRVHGIFRKGAIDVASLKDATINITEPAERALAVKLLQLPAVISSVAQSLEPHRLCAWLYETAAGYHKFFESCPVLTAPNEATKRSRLRLSEVTARAFKLGLGLLGIDVVERM